MLNSFVTYVYIRTIKIEPMQLAKESLLNQLSVFSLPLSSTTFKEVLVVSEKLLSGSFLKTSIFRQLLLTNSLSSYKSNGDVRCGLSGGH